MAITQNTLIGRASGSVGGATFSTWKGINVLKSKATTVANPQTVAQIAQRVMFAAAVALYRSFPAIIRQGYTQRAIRMSAYNAFVSANLKNGAITQVAGVASVNENLVQISAGTIPFTNVTPDTSVIVGDPIEFTWPATLEEGQSANDELNILLVSSTGLVIAEDTAVALRSDGVATMLVPNGTPAAAGNRFISFFSSADGRKVSDSDNDVFATTL